MTMDGSIILFCHGLHILKYSEKPRRIILAQLSANRQKKKNTHIILSIFISMKATSRLFEMFFYQKHQMQLL